MKKQFILSLILSLFVTIVSYGQTIDDIKQQVKSLLDSKYDISFLVDVEAFDGRNTYAYQDPYNTLSGTFLVMASGSSTKHGLIGIYENGVLIWNTDPILTGSTYRHFLGSRELNGDGKVELIFGWKLGVNPRGSFLWIVSWDGNTGQIINKLDERGRPEIYAGGDVIFYPDFEGDGIFEIMTYDYYDEDEDDSNDLYYLLKWDGINYNLTQKVQQKNLTLSQFDRKGFSVLVNADIKKESGKFVFQYNIFNEDNSMKKIEDVHIKPSFSMFRKVSIPKSRDFFNSRYEVLTLTVDGLEKGNFSLAPGDSLFFSFSTESLVGISNFYIQSFNDFPPVASLNATDEEHKEDIQTNSESGHTLGPWLPDSSMSLEAFTDTLETFRHRSCSELGWTTDSTVCSQLEQQVNEVGNYLSTQDTLQAANTLQNFIELMEAEKDASLTSEGYALLYYNAQYLAQRLAQSGQRKDLHK